MDYLIGYGQRGRLVPVRDVRALANAMREAPGRDKLPIGAMRKAADEFTIERSAAIYLELLAARQR